MTRVGDSLPRPVDARIIAASNKPLADLVEAGRFREDLYYRLRVVALTVPPLRDRREDIGDLMAHFIMQFNTQYDRHIEGCSPRAMAQLLGYHWPGNVRQLEHVIEHAFAVSGADQRMITAELLPMEFTGSTPKSPDRTRSSLSDDADEKTRLIETLERTGGNKSQAASLLGITRAGLYKRMRRLGL